MRCSASLVVLLTSLLAASTAGADGTCTATPAGAASTPGASSASTPAREESPVTRARDLLARAKLLDEAATADEKAATELTARLPALRASAKTARDRADRAPGDDREVLVSRAEDLEADLTVSEAEAAVKRRVAADNRRVARELRTRAVRLVRETPSEPASTDTTCDPPYRYTVDGRKIYRIECLK
jgi:hypothetical protein